MTHGYRYLLDMHVRHAVLAVLADAPAHGYEIKRGLEQRFGLIIASDVLAIQGNPPQAATPLEGGPGLGPVHQHVPHDLRRDSEDVRPVVPSGIGAGHEAHEDFLHQGGRLDIVVLTFAVEVTPSESAQFRPD